MSEWNELAHFLYSPEFWYADPLREIRGLTEEQLFWVPETKSLCALWHVGHVGHRERLHVGRFLQGLEGEIIPAKYEVFGPEWHSVDEVRESIDSVAGVLEWVREVRQESQDYITSLNEDDFHKVPATSEAGLSVAHWLFITVAHGAIHIGRIQLLRALIEGEEERAC